jgi:hypothetical protein
MCIVAAGRASNVAIPSWVHVTTLIEILAVEQGAAFEAQDFGGILAAMFSNDLQPMLGTYTVDDVDAILEAEERVADLEPRAFEQVGIAVARARVRGEKPDEIELLVKRAFQHERTDIVAQRDAALARSAGSDRDLKTEREARQNTERTLEEGFVRQHSATTRRNYRLSAAGLAIIGIVLAVVGLNILLMAGTDATLAWVGGFLASTGLVVVPGVILRRRADALSALRAGPDLARAYVATARGGRASSTEDH